MILTHGCLQCHWFYSIGGSTWNVGRIGCSSGMHLYQSTGIHSHWCSNFAKPYLPFFFISLYKKSLRPLGGLRKRHLSNVFSLLIQMTLCSVLLYHNIVNIYKVWVMFAWISLETKWCWLDLGKLSKRVKIISVLQTGSVWSLPYPAILQIIWNTKTSCSDSCWDIYPSAFASWTLS